VLALRLELGPRLTALGQLSGEILLGRDELGHQPLLGAQGRLELRGVILQTLHLADAVGKLTLHLRELGLQRRDPRLRLVVDVLRGRGEDAGLHRRFEC